MLPHTLYYSQISSSLIAAHLSVRPHLLDIGSSRDREGEGRTRGVAQYPRWNLGLIF